MKLEFSPHITKNTQILNFMKLCPVGAEFQADKLMDRQTWSWQSLFAILQMRLKMDENETILPYKTKTSITRQM